MSRTNQEIFIDLKNLCEPLKNLVICGNLDFKRDRFLSLRNEIKAKYPKDILFNKPGYYTSSFDWTLADIQKEYENLKELLEEHWDE